MGEVPVARGALDERAQDVGIDAGARAIGGAFFEDIIDHPGDEGPGFAFVELAGAGFVQALGAACGGDIVGDEVVGACGGFLAHDGGFGLRAHPVAFDFHFEGEASVEMAGKVALVLGFGGEDEPFAGAFDACEGEDVGVEIVEGIDLGVEGGEGAFDGVEIGEIEGDGFGDPGQDMQVWNIAWQEVGDGFGFGDHPFGDGFGVVLGMADGAQADGEDEEGGFFEAQHGFAAALDAWPGPFAEDGEVGGCCQAGEGVAMGMEELGEAGGVGGNVEHGAPALGQDAGIGANDDGVVFAVDFGLSLPGGAFRGAIIGHAGFDVRVLDEGGEGDDGAGHEGAPRVWEWVVLAFRHKTTHGSTRILGFLKGGGFTECFGARQPWAIYFEAPTPQAQGLVCHAVVAHCLFGFSGVVLGHCGFCPARGICPAHKGGDTAGFQVPGGFGAPGTPS